MFLFSPACDSRIALVSDIIRKSVGLFEYFGIYSDFMHIGRDNSCFLSCDKACGNVVAFARYMADLHADFEFCGVHRSIIKTMLKVHKKMLFSYKYFTFCIYLCKKDWSKSLDIYIEL